MIPATLSSRTYEQLRSVVAAEAAGGPKVLAFFSMLDRRKLLHRDVVERLPRQHPGVLGTAIPTAADVERMGMHRTVLQEFAPRGRAARAYRALWSEIGQRLGDGASPLNGA
jgi:cellulose biosynthesis protein BcsQ